MCNLHRLAPKDELAIYLRQHVAQLALPEWPEKLDVGPFDEGVFLVSDGAGGLKGIQGQWGMIRPGQAERIEYKEFPPKKPGGKPRREPMLKNNSRWETVAKSPAFKEAWKQGRRCLVPAEWLAEPNWETQKCVWWRLKRADGLPWMVAGIHNEWVDPQSGEVVPNFAFLTFNVNSHPLLNRLHRPELDPATRLPLPPEQQDKRGEASIAPQDWMRWLDGSVDEAQALLVPPPPDMFDLSDAHKTDELLSAERLL